MKVSDLNHFTLRCEPGDLERLRSFYVDVLALEEGPRPEFPFPGHWLYAEGRPIVHLAALADVRPAAATGPLDHISFSSDGLQDIRARLHQLGISFQEAPVPGWPLHQIFLMDPGGLKIELTFALERSVG